MRTLLLAAATLALMGAGPVLAQTAPGQPEAPTPPSERAQPPAGAYQGYFESREPEQTAEVPSEAAHPHPHPGTLKKFNSNSGYGPEVEFEVERREAQQKQQQK